MKIAKKAGISALAVRNVGHTGRHGAFADEAAEEGFLTLCTGGGNREIWRQVAPHGGAKALLPTNPWCAGIPGGEHKGYALALMGELIGEAMLGPSTTECNWILITIDTKRFREPSAMRCVAEGLLEELRQCPPASGFERVEIPGEREREYRTQSNGAISIPEDTWQQILALQTAL